MISHDHKQNKTVQKWTHCDKKEIRQDRERERERERGKRTTGEGKHHNIISHLSRVIVQVRVVFRKTVVADYSFDYLRGSYLQSQVESRR